MTKETNDRKSKNLAYLKKSTEKLSNTVEFKEKRYQTLQLLNDLKDFSEGSVVKNNENSTDEYTQATVLEKMTFMAEEATESKHLPIIKYNEKTKTFEISIKDHPYEKIQIAVIHIKEREDNKVETNSVTRFPATQNKKDIISEVKKKVDVDKKIDGIRKFLGHPEDKDVSLFEQYYFENEVAQSNIDISYDESKDKIVMKCDDLVVEILFFKKSLITTYYNKSKIKTPEAIKDKFKAKAEVKDNGDKVSITVDDCESRYQGNYEITKPDHLVFTKVEGNKLKITIKDEGLFFPGKDKDLKTIDLLDGDFMKKIEIALLKEGYETKSSEKKLEITEKTKQKELAEKDDSWHKKLSKELKLELYEAKLIVPLPGMPDYSTNSTKFSKYSKKLIAENKDFLNKYKKICQHGKDETFCKNCNDREASILLQLGADAGI